MVYAKKGEFVIGYHSTHVWVVCHEFPQMIAWGKIYLRNQDELKKYYEESTHNIFSKDENND